ncbi:H-type small acid-soluble spore protein [Staphylospora marina]|uniref:H-type small acid-soluble spore protein n=1 Tax=Staphylospora marina TaxID=2490858 RepID=UPI001F14D481|nr:H-type small acid-soluble spore protein [Staphylospora marina]
MMTVERCQEILASPDKITVTYMGEPVWIDKVDATTRTALVNPESRPDEHKTVPVHDLVEHPQH